MNFSIVGMISRNRSDIFLFFFQTTYGLVAWFEYLDDVLPVHKAGKV